MNDAPDRLANFRRELPRARTVDEVEGLRIAAKIIGEYTPEVQAMLAVRKAEIMRGRK
jgi:hypothetical protein